MPIKYDKLIKLLEKKGWTPGRIRKERLISQGTWDNIKKGKGGIDDRTLARLCAVLGCQPGDILEYEYSESDKVVPTRTKK